MQNTPENLLPLANGTRIVTAMATFHSSLPLLCHSLLHSSLSVKIFISALFCTVSLILLSVFALFLYSKYRSSKRRIQERRVYAACYTFLNTSKNDEEPVGESECLTRSTNSLLVKVIPPQLVIVKDGEDKTGLDLEHDRVGLLEQEDNKKRKMKKRTRKKRIDPNAIGEEEKTEPEEPVLLYPFTTSSSGIQRKIKEHFDQLVKFHQSNCLTMTQVGQFTTFLLEAKKELQHRSEVIERKFRITKALLMKADRSSFDRLRQQIDRIELEQKRLQEDAFVYNRVQQHLRVSPTYNKIIKACDCRDMKGKTMKEVGGSDNDIADISFEELLAQEKRDVFWQKHRKPKG